MNNHEYYLALCKKAGLKPMGRFDSLREDAKKTVIRSALISTSLGLKPGVLVSFNKGRLKMYGHIVHIGSRYNGLAEVWIKTENYSYYVNPQDVEITPLPNKATHIILNRGQITIMRSIGDKVIKRIYNRDNLTSSSLNRLLNLLSIPFWDRIEDYRHSWHYVFGCPSLEEIKTRPPLLLNSQVLIETHEDGRVVVTRYKSNGDIKRQRTYRPKHAYSFMESLLACDEFKSSKETLRLYMPDEKVISDFTVDYHWYMRS